MATAHLSIRIAWWLRYYLIGLVLMHRLTGMQPNWGRVSHWAGKAIKPECRSADG